MAAAGGADRGGHAQAAGQQPQADASPRRRAAPPRAADAAARGCAATGARRDSGKEDERGQRPATGDRRRQCGATAPSPSHAPRGIAIPVVRSLAPDRHEAPRASRTPPRPRCSRVRRSSASWKGVACRAATILAMVAGPTPGSAVELRLRGVVEVDESRCAQAPAPRVSAPGHRRSRPAGAPWPMTGTTTLSPSVTCWARLSSARGPRQVGIGARSHLPARARHRRVRRPAHGSALGARRRPRRPRPGRRAVTRRRRCRRADGRPRQAVPDVGRPDRSRLDDHAAAAGHQRQE